jgi:hypothetical protein
MIKMETAVIIILCAIVGIGYSYLTHTDDSALEEMAEMIIEEEIGLPDDSVDLTPSSKEVKK